MLSSARFFVVAALALFALAVWYIFVYVPPDSAAIVASEENDLLETIHANYARNARYSFSMRPVTGVKIQGRNATIYYQHELPVVNDLSEVVLWFYLYPKWHSGRQKCVTAEYRASDGHARNLKWCGSPM